MSQVGTGKRGTSEAETSEVSVRAGGAKAARGRMARNMVAALVLLAPLALLLSSKAREKSLVPEDMAKEAAGVGGPGEASPSGAAPAAAGDGAGNQNDAGAKSNSGAAGGTETLTGKMKTDKGTDAAGDPYAALMLYNGKWDVVTSADKDVTHLENHCAKTGLFFSCEQVVNGKSVALVVFLPVGKATGGGDQYKTKGLPANGSLGGDWGDLRIDGSTWVYSWDSENDGKKTHFRNTNTFTGSDKIHFQIESSDDGTTWKPGMSGSEQRGK